MPVEFFSGSHLSRESPVHLDNWSLPSNARKFGSILRESGSRLNNPSPKVSAAAAVLVRPFESSIVWDMRYRSEFDIAERNTQTPVLTFEVVRPGYVLAR